MSGLATRREDAAPPAYDVATIGGRIIAERHRAGLSQEALAYLIGVTRATIIAWELGRTHPNAAALRLMAALGLRTDYIVRGEDGDSCPTVPGMTEEIALLRAQLLVMPDEVRARIGRVLTALASEIAP